MPAAIRVSGIWASEAVAAALWTLLRYWKKPADCNIQTVGCRGDTDTIDAMAGVLIGALTRSCDGFAPLIERFSEDLWPIGITG